MNLRIAFFALCTTVFLTALGCTGEAASPDPPADMSNIPATAEQTNPLGVGAMIPLVTLQTVDKKPFDLRLAVEKQPTVLIFYRGGW